jgi:hypothetical protein
MGQQDTENERAPGHGALHAVLTSLLPSAGAREAGGASAGCEQAAQAQEGAEWGQWMYRREWPLAAGSSGGAGRSAPSAGHASHSGGLYPHGSQGGITCITYIYMNPKTVMSVTTSCSLETQNSSPFNFLSCPISLLHVYPVLQRLECFPVSVCRFGRGVHPTPLCQVPQVPIDMALRLLLQRH